MKSEPATTEPGSVSESFYSGALTRISRFMVVLAVLCAAGAWWRFGWPAALGLVSGCAIAYLNFHWLKRVVDALAEGVTRSGQRPSGGRVVLRFVLRYLLAVAAAYVLFRLAPATMAGFLAGLFLPVGAILCEAAYEVQAALFRGM
ncbi:MAG TPA: ATP synthase subunit I [Terriglobales bacterium]|nr:ATP synthase subunit I [Terriglobales bacterium]